MKGNTMDLIPHAAFGFRATPDPAQNPRWQQASERRAGTRPKGRTERTTRPKGRRRRET